MSTRLMKWWKEWRCEHFWRPALATRTYSNKHFANVTLTNGVRVCDYCQRQDDLTDAEFYAQFGRIPKPL